MGRLDGTAAVVAGAASAQGKSRCQRLAEVGADLLPIKKPHASHAFVAASDVDFPFVELRDSSNAILFFASDEAGYMTCNNLRVEAGSLIKWPDGPQG